MRNKAVYLALAMTSGGDKEVLGLWIGRTEGAEFWLKVMNEIQDSRPAGHPHRDGGRAQGLSHAIGTVFPRIAVHNTP